MKYFSIPLVLLSNVSVVNGMKDKIKLWVKIKFKIKDGKYQEQCMNINKDLQQELGLDHDNFVISKSHYVKFKDFFIEAVGGCMNKTEINNNHNVNLAIRVKKAIQSQAKDVESDFDDLTVEDVCTKNPCNFKQWWKK